jgi:hypothetical protein
MSTAEVLGITVAAVSAAANILFLGFLLIQVRLLRDQVVNAKSAFEVDQRRASKHATLDYLGSTMERRHTIISVLPSIADPGGIANILSRADEDIETRRLVERYIGYYEHLSVGVNTGALDKEIVDRTMGGTLIQIWHSYKPWILQQRKKRNWPSLYIEIEFLALKAEEARGQQSDTKAENSPDLG